MEYRVLGRTGIRVSRLGLGAMVLGTWGNNDQADCRRLIHRALDAGINLVDTADMYGEGSSERIVGEALRGRRDKVVLATKFHHPVGDGDHDDRNRRGNSRLWMIRAVEDSLRRLDTDWIDLYQVHRPDPDTEIVETVSALDDLVRAGKIRAWGTSTFPPAEIVEARWAAERRGASGPSTEQPPYSILCRGIERDVLPLCRRLGMGVLTWCPLSGGWLTGKYTRADLTPPGSRADTNPVHFDVGNQQKLAAVEQLSEVAKEAGLSLVQLALAWNTEHPAVTAALVGCRTLDHLEAALEASEVRLDETALDAVDDIVAPGVNLNEADTGWIPPALDPRQRRRQR